MRILCDTNIVLDVLLEREPFVEDSKQVWKAIDEEQVAGYITASTVTDIYYVVRKAAGLDKAHDSVRVCLETFEICTVDRHALETAANLPESDFEDALQVACATITGLDAIVTRDKAAFKSTTITVLTPEEALQQLQPSGGTS